MSRPRGAAPGVVKLQQAVTQLQALMCCDGSQGQADVHPTLLSLSEACGFTDWRMLKPPVEITAAVLSQAVDHHPFHLQPYIVALAQQEEDEVVERYTQQTWELVKVLGDPLIAKEVAEAWRHLFNQLRKNLPYLQQQAAAARTSSLPRQGSHLTAAAAARPSTQSSSSPPLPAAVAATSDDDSSPTPSVLRIRGGACGSSTESASASEEEEEGQLATDEGDKQRQQQQQQQQQQQEEKCQQQSHLAGSGSQGAEQQQEEPTASNQPAAAAFTTTQAAPPAAAGMAAARAPGRLHDPYSTADIPPDIDDLDRRFVLYAGFWEDRLQQQRGPKLAARGNIQPAALQDVRAFKPSASPKHFQGMQAAAALQWLELMIYARQVAPDFMQPAWRR